MDYLEVALRNDSRWKGVGSLHTHRRRFMVLPWDIAVRQAWYLHRSKQIHRSSRTASPAYGPPSPSFTNSWLDGPLPDGLLSPQLGPKEDTIDIRKTPRSQHARRTLSPIGKQPRLAKKAHELHPRIPSRNVTKTQGQGEVVWIPAATSPPARRPESPSSGASENQQQIDLHPVSPEDEEDVATSPAGSEDGQGITTKTGVLEKEQEPSLGPVTPEIQEDTASSPDVLGQQDVGSSLTGSDHTIHHTPDLGQIPLSFEFEESFLATTGAVPGIPSDAEPEPSNPTESAAQKPADSPIKGRRTEEDEMSVILPPKKRKNLASQDPHVFFLKADRWQCKNAKKEPPKGRSIRAPGPRRTPAAGVPKVRVPTRRGQGETTAPVGQPKEIYPPLAEHYIRERRLAARESRAQATEDMTRYERAKEGGVLVKIVRRPFIPIRRNAWSILPGKILQ
ncbi:hypothetical protein GGTG_12636 [Gaeumannomyces tritici R3-111a-1]|uniref:Uncharacterized protein n=1 Tax=Gaeumannomyces tritici (strain R3-111a-1) TaxID=644352 RepID=J3PGK7_GAET3|nr:hypothetical protein GGTG_12636 [Gaeumannomyces tritici R3-111a-1]EJT69753.1 hypothetical protein GGTG_12636 [Gaeumannomyces tritici R3-111a-1]